jgi:hypothetical protein
MPQPRHSAAIPQPSFYAADRRDTTPSKTEKTKGIHTVKARKSWLKFYQTAYCFIECTYFAGNSIDTH